MGISFSPPSSPTASGSRILHGQGIAGSWERPSVNGALFVSLARPPSDKGKEKQKTESWEELDHVVQSPFPLNVPFMTTLLSPRSENKFWLTYVRQSLRLWNGLPTAIKEACFYSCAQLSKYKARSFEWHSWPFTVHRHLEQFWHGWKSSPSPSDYVLKCSQTTPIAAHCCHRAPERRGL